MERKIGMEYLSQFLLFAGAEGNSEERDGTPDISACGSMISLLIRARIRSIISSDLSRSNESDII